MTEGTVSRERAGRAVLWASIGWYSTFVLSFAFNIVTARLLLPEVFGLVALVLIVVTVAQLFADAGTRAALVHRETRIEDAVSTALISVPTAGFLGSCLIAACSPLFAAFYGEPELTWIAFAMAWLLFIFSLSLVPDALLQRRLDLKLRRAVVDPLSIVGYGVTVIIGALAGLEAWALVLGQYVSFTIVTVGCWVLARPRFREGRPSWGMYREIGRYGRGLLAANSVEAVEGQAAPVVLGRALGTEAVGLYSAGTRIGKLPLTGIVQVTGGIVFATLARLQGEMDRFRAVAFEALRMNAVLVLPVGVTFMALGEPIVVVLFGEVWRGAGIVLQFIGFWAVCLGLGDNGREIFKAIGRPFLVARAAIIETTATIALLAMFWMMDEISLWTVGLTRAITAGIILGCYAVGVHAVGALPLGWQWRAVRGPVAAAIVQAGVLVGAHVLLPDGFERWHRIGDVPLGVLPALGALGGLFLAGIAVYGATLWLIDRSAIIQLRANVATAVRGRRG
ncbi:MAG TPA: oligosaccharide flippase family protein [Miltoncostaeaceae bacterium]|nr:oligosaccharide flippase family protein [Miltoncostaeaceae bacterium]